MTRSCKCHTTDWQDNQIVQSVYSDANAALHQPNLASCQLLASRFLAIFSMRRWLMEQFLSSHWNTCLWDWSVQVDRFVGPWKSFGNTDQLWCEWSQDHNIWLFRLRSESLSAHLSPCVLFRYNILLNMWCAGTISLPQLCETNGINMNIIT